MTVRVLFAVLLVLFGCKAKPVATRPDAAPVSSDHGPSPGARAAASLVASVRSTELSLAAPNWQLQPLAFGKGLLVRLADKRVEAYSMPGAELLFEQPLEEPRGAVEIAGGSVVVVAAGVTLRIDPGAKQPVRLPAIPFLPGTVLVPDRTDSNGLWSVHSAGKVLARQVLDISGKRRLEGVVTLADYDGGPITALRDGALVYRAADGVRRALPGGRAHPLKTDFVPWRLLPARRVDQVWAVGKNGLVELWQVGERIAVKWQASLGEPPFDVASSSEYLAAVVVQERRGVPRRFGLVVLSEIGDVMHSEDLGPDAPVAGEKWAAFAGRDRHVAIAEGEPLVAVGGPGSVRVVRAKGGAVVLAR
jgi:hypothetical protein